jgi:translation initiation factor IF-3
MSVPQALTLARERGLDLVEVAPNAVPPVCRILDYGKLRYLYSKKEREAKKSQKNTALREVRFRPHIGSHDFTSKVRKVRELIDDGAKVKVAVVFRGRELAHREIGVSLLKRVADEMQEEAKLERPPDMEGRAMSIVLTPAARKVEKKVAEVSDAEAEDPQGSQGQVPGNGNRQDHAAQEDEQPPPPQEAEERAPAVLGEA